jgi:hypothetical protein
VIIARFATEGCDALPVADHDGTYRGTVIARDVEDSAQDATAATLARAVPTLHTDQNLERPSPCWCTRTGRDYRSFPPTTAGFAAG